MKNQLNTLKNCMALAIICMFCSNIAIAVPAYPYPIEFTQPDGSKITIILKGDEKTKWAETADGYSIMFNNNGAYEYAVVNAYGDMVPSGIQAQNAAVRTQSEITFLSKTSKGISYSAAQRTMMRSAWNVYQQEIQKAFPTSGSRKLICILIGFKDKAFTKTKTDFNNLLNQVGYNADGATGSVKDFYLENSYGKLNLSVTVAGPYTAANNMAYYGGNDANGSDLRPRELITEAVKFADNDVNYADFDNDGDGNVDGVYVIFAGYGEEAGASSNAIWSHAWSIPAITLDGKVIKSYSCSPELRGTSGTGITRIGVICHEFGHVLGSPDFYDTNYSTGGQYDGTGNWDLMAGGSWNNNGTTPAHHNAYTKVMIYKWGTATTLSSATSVTMSNAEENSSSFYRINTATANEYYLAENRQKLKFDSYIPGHGMIIYHVDESFMGSAGGGINAGSHQGMYPVCANATGNPPSTYGSVSSGGCPFPGTGAKTSFTDATTPNAKSWSGANTNKPITSIAENTGTITFKFMNGGVNTSENIALEAESGQISSPMAIQTDAAASGGKYIMAPSGTNSSTTPPSTGYSTISFSTKGSGSYKVWGRTIAPTTSTNSFYIRVDGGSWVTWNDNATVSTAWIWNTLASFTLSTGSHTITIAYREGGTKLDKLILSNDAAYVPTGLGDGGTTPTLPVAPSNLVASAASSNQINLSWSDNSIDESNFKVERSVDALTWTSLATLAANTTSYSSIGLSASTTYYYRVLASNAAGSSAYSNTANATTQAGTSFENILLEAEAGQISSPMAIQSDATASAGKYIMTPSGTNSTAAAPSSGNAIYIFTVTGGSYKIWCKTIMPTTSSNSFWIRIDNGSWISWNVDANVSTAWKWNQTTTASLAAGSHVLTIAYREGGTKLDCIALSNDPAFNPVTNLKSASEIIPIGFRSSILTNPVSGSNVQVKFELSEPSVVKAEIYGLNGIRFTTWISEELAAGSYDKAIDISTLPDGMYILNITSGQTIKKTIKVIVMH
jgi:M6 family metalloprotease-like protein